MSLVLQAHALGLAAHQMSGFDAKAFRDAFEIPADVAIPAIISLGHYGNVDKLDPVLRDREKARARAMRSARSRMPARGRRASTRRPSRRARLGARASAPERVTALTVRTARPTRRRRPHHQSGAPTTVTTDTPIRLIEPRRDTDARPGCDPAGFMLKSPSFPFSRRPRCGTFR
jgi:hypothetical protein